MEGGLVEHGREYAAHDPVATAGDDTKPTRNVVCNRAKDNIFWVVVVGDALLPLHLGKNKAGQGYDSKSGIRSNLRNDCFAVPIQLKAESPTVARTYQTRQTTRDRKSTRLNSSHKSATRM